MYDLITPKFSPVNFNLKLGHVLFSDPQRERYNAIVVANTSDLTVNIQPGDLIQIDFTATEITDGLYIITLDDGWIGYRFFQRLPTLHMNDSEGSHPITLSMLNSIKVVGKVKDIFRSGNRELS